MTHKEKEGEEEEGDIKRSRGKRKGITGPLILIAIGLIFLLHNFDLIPYGFGDLWPLILIVIGIGCLYDALVN